MAELVIASRFWNMNEAHVAKGVLDQHGVTAFLFDQHLAANGWHLLFALKGLRLMVPAPELAMARRLLATPATFEEEGDWERCPVCDSTDVFRHSSVVIAVMMILLASLPTPIAIRRRTCRACKHQWRTAENIEKMRGRSVP